MVRGVVRVCGSALTDFERMGDGQTDGWMDTPSYRDARTHLKMIGSGGFSKKGDRPTDRRMDRPSYRDARTHLKMIRGGW